jgi:hypothetical protein
MPYWIEGKWEGFFSQIVVILEMILALPGLYRDQP